MKKKRGKYIFLSILGILCIVIILNLGKIRFMLNMIKSYNDINKEEYKDLAGDDASLETTENPLLKIIDEETIDKVDDKSYVSVVSDFNNKFGLLEKDYEAKLDSLIKVGYEEYKSGELSTAKLASKYINEGSRLEADCDANFNAMVKEMEKELKDNGHDTSVVKDLREYYSSYKKSSRSQLMGKAKKYMD